MHALILLTIDQRTTFVLLSFTNSRGMLGREAKSKKAHDLDHTH